MLISTLETVYKPVCPIFPPLSRYLHLCFESLATANLHCGGYKNQIHKLRVF